MKTCAYCGTSYTDTVLVCPLDGRTLPPAVITPVAPSHLQSGGFQSAMDAEHLRILSILHFVVAGLNLCVIAFLALHFTIVSVALSTVSLHSHSGTPVPSFILPVLMMVYLFAGTFTVATGLLNLFSGIFLRQRKYRVFSLITAGVNCLHFPLGTILGIFTIIVLSRDSVQNEYQAAIQAPTSGTPGYGGFPNR